MNYHGKHITHNKHFYLVLRPFQDYFSLYETGQSVGGAKTWFVSHVACAGLEPTADTAVI